MKHVKSVEKMGLGYTNIDFLNAGAVGKMSAKIEIVVNEIDHLWTCPGLTYEDLHKALRNIEKIFSDIVEEG